MLAKRSNTFETRSCSIGKDGFEINKLSDYFLQNSSICSFRNAESWVVLTPIELSIKQKIEAAGTPLKDWDVRINYGIKTGFNDAFIIDGAKRAELIAADPKSAEIIRPLLRGRDIKRYNYEYADLYIIATFPAKHYNIDDYPAVKAHLLSYGIERLEQTGKEYIVDGKKVKARKKTNNQWFETQDSISYMDDFNKQKIVWKRVGSILRFAYDDCGLYTLDSTCFATGNHIPFLVAILNSKIGHYLLKDSPKTGTGDLLISVQAIEPLRIPIPSVELEEKIKLLLYRNNSIAEYELDQLFFQLYKLSSDEIEWIEKA